MAGSSGQCTGAGAITSQSPLNMQRPSGTGNFLNDVTRTGRVVEREALLRWQREDGLIGPDQFLDVAAEAGMLCEIGERVLDVACAQAAAWRRQAALVVPVAVNVAPEQLREPSLVETVTRALARHGVPPDALVLEVTEQGVLAEEVVAHEVLTTLRSMGVRIALDDFGTGLSSLSHLARLPVDAIKVDRQFVTGALPAHRAIVRAVATLGQALDLEVVAEGIETTAHAASALHAGCTRGQGWLYGHPHAAGGRPQTPRRRRPTQDQQPAAR